MPKVNHCQCAYHAPHLTRPVKMRPMDLKSIPSSQLKTRHCRPSACNNYDFFMDSVFKMMNSVLQMMDSVLKKLQTCARAFTDSVFPVPAGPYLCFYYIRSTFLNRKSSFFNLKSSFLRSARITTCHNYSFCDMKFIILIHNSSVLMQNSSF